MERGALGFVGAGSVDINIGWSVERWVRLERGALMSKGVGARSGNGKIGRSAERWRPPNGPHLGMTKHVMVLKMHNKY